MAATASLPADRRSLVFGSHHSLGSPFRTSPRTTAGVDVCEVKGPQDRLGLLAADARIGATACQDGEGYRYQNHTPRAVPHPSSLQPLQEFAVLDRGREPASRCEGQAEADAIRAAFEQHGEPLAAVELRRLFPSVTDNVRALACARTIACLQPLHALGPTAVAGFIAASMALQRSVNASGRLARMMERVDAIPVGAIRASAFARCAAPALALMISTARTGRCRPAHGCVGESATLTALAISGQRHPAPTLAPVTPAGRDRLLSKRWPAHAPRTCLRAKTTPGTHTAFAAPWLRPPRRPPHGPGDNQADICLIAGRSASVSQRSSLSS